MFKLFKKKEKNTPIKDKTLGKCHISSEDYYNRDFIVFYTKGFEVNKIVRNGEVILKKKV